MRTEMIRELGYLDEAFIYNYDDYDLGYRIWQAGFTLIHDPRVSCHHLKLPSGGSRKELTGAKRRLNKYTAKYYFLAKHFSRRAVVVEFVSDVLLAAWDLKWNIPKAVKELALAARGFRQSATYSEALDHSRST
jgi:GT2 family glycosyltransferase